MAADWAEKSGIAGRRASASLCRTSEAPTYASTAAIATPATIARRLRLRAGATIAPDRHARHAIVRTTDMHPAGHQVRRAVLVEIANGERDEMRRRSSGRMH